MVLLGERITITAVARLAMIIGGAEIALRGNSARRVRSESKAHQYWARPLFHQADALKEAETPNPQHWRR
jgi:hypothetical protein